MGGAKVELHPFFTFTINPSKELDINGIGSRNSRSVSCRCVRFRVNCRAVHCANLCWCAVTTACNSSSKATVCHYSDSVYINISTYRYARNGYVATLFDVRIIPQRFAVMNRLNSCTVTAALLLTLGGRTAAHSNGRIRHYSHETGSIHTAHFHCTAMSREPTYAVSNA